jgi:hypothetical protein
MGWDDDDAHLLSYVFDETTPTFRIHVASTTDWPAITITSVNDSIRFDSSDDYKKRSTTTIIREKEVKYFPHPPPYNQQK